MIEWANQPWEMPMFSAIVFAYDQDNIETIPTVFRGACLDWLDSEEDMSLSKRHPRTSAWSPQTSISRHRHHSPPDEPGYHNPQAGPNLNIWLDICEELQISRLSLPHQRMFSKT